MAVNEKVKSKNNKKLFPELDRVPPQSIEAEMAVLGSIMIDNASLGKVVDFLRSECFYRTPHQKIFSSALSLYEKNEPVDLITLSEELKRVKQIEEVGGAYYLTELAESIPSAANVEYHAHIVLEKFLLRRLIEQSAEIARECYDSTDDIYDIIDRSEQKIFSLSENRLKRNFQHISPIMHQTFETIESFHERKGAVTGIPTGFKKLDELTSGFQNGEFIVVGGRPSMGKTAFCLNIARNAAIKSKIPVGIFSLEMSSRQLALRMLCATARVDAHRVRTGSLPEKEWQKLSTVAGTITEAPIYIDDTPGATVLELRAKARRLKKDHNIGIIFIDYLQLMQGTRNAVSRQQEISIISRSLKGLSAELDIPVVALSQLSRAVEMRGGDKRPRLSDLRESGAIEQDADVVLFIYRPAFYEKKEDEQGSVGEEKQKSEIIIDKQRNGPVGTIYLNFVKKWACFEDPAPDSEPPF
ncbi:MAG: replicative DNA helicase [bacterium]